MSTSGGTAALTADRAANRHALRIAGGVALPFMVGEALGWPAPFLASIFALQLLAVRQAPLTLLAALANTAALAAAFLASIVLTAIVLPYPAVFLLGAGLAVFGGLYGQARTGSPFWFILLVAVSATPLLAGNSEALATGFVGVAVAAMATAIATSWLMHAAFPDPEEAPPPGPPPTMDQASAARMALIGTLVMMPLMLLLLGNESSAVVIAVTALSILKASSPQGGARAALGLLAANLVAGAVAVGAYALVSAVPTLAMLAAATVAVSLAFGAVIAMGGERAALASAACAAAVLLFGSGLSPLYDSGTAFVDRLTNVLVASAYTVAAYILLERLLTRRSPCV
jgi:hypothetical protein